MTTPSSRIAVLTLPLLLTLPLAAAAQSSQATDTPRIEEVMGAPADVSGPRAGALLGLPLMEEASAGGAASGTPLGEPVAVSTEEAASRLIASMSGYSGSLHAMVVSSENTWPLDSDELPLRWISMYPSGPALLGRPARSESMDSPGGPGIYMVERPADEGSAFVPLPLAVITLVPFERKRGGYLNGYHIGRYSTEGSGRTDIYAPPEGFIEVTPANQDFQVSEHFRLRQFLTKDQGSIWPKYVALDLRLIDKLELVLQELNAMGVRAEGMHVMSGFRTPQYNGPGGNGRASLSRHTYGDAADVWVDSDGNGFMDDLNGDGRSDLDDARVMMRAVERVEARYPELIGGAGVYVANSAHGPFIHIDVRGRRARW